jgi:lysophospholipase L1-like esterase
MSINQTRLVIFMTGLFLLSVTVYKWQAFTHFAWSIILFKAFVPISFLMVCYGLGRLLRIPLILCLTIPILLEIACWSYIRHVMRVNQTAAVHGVGILEQWINYRDVIQFNGQFSNYSSDLGYTLRPRSEGYHADLEYENKFTINSFGVRDDEKSLQNPKMIFIGDSFTMGWGVDQDKTFAHLTEKQTGAKAINAGISSYGTYREMLLFSKLQRDSCKLLVIQYCDNDLEENLARNEPNSQGQLLTSEKFKKVTVFNHLNEGYYPMRYTYFFLREKHLFKRIFTNPVEVWQDTFEALSSWISGKPLVVNAPPFIQSVAASVQHTENFFKVLAKIRALYPGNIVVMHIAGRYTKPEIINAFEAKAKKEADAKLYFLRNTDILTTNDYYPIDGHLNAKGHQKIANSLSKLIREKNLLN